MRRMMSLIGLRVSRPIDAGDTEADGVRRDVAVAERLVHHPMQDLLDLELAHDLQVGADARASARTSPRSSASRHTVFVPPASMPSTCIRQLKYDGTFRFLPCSVASRSWRARSPRRTSVDLSVRRDAARCRDTQPDARRGQRTAAHVLGFPRLARFAQTPCAVRVAAAAAAARSTRSWCRSRSSADAFQVFDGAREMINEARARGLRVHAWIEVTLVAADGELPAVARSRALSASRMADGAARAGAGDAEGRRAKPGISRTARRDGLAPIRHASMDCIVSPLAPDAAVYLVAAVTAAAKRYPVDGVFLDAVRFPGVDFDYSRHAMEIFRAETRPQLSAEERARLDEVEAIDPFGYAEEFPDGGGRSGSPA